MFRLVVSTGFFLGNISLILAEEWRKKITKSIEN
jgi:hypothetical protein